MASPRKKPVTIDVEPEAFNTPEEAARAASLFPVAPGHEFEEDEDDVTLLNKVLDELGAEEDGEGYVTAFRILKSPGNNKREEYLGKYAIGEFSLDLMKDTHGGGEYHVRVYRGGGKGMATRKIINIAGNVATPATTVHAASNNSEMLQAIQGLGNLMVEGFKQMAAHRPAEDAEEKLLSRMMMYKELFASTNTPQPNVNAFEIFKQGIEMAQMASGGEGSGTALWLKSAVETFGPSLAKVLENASAMTPQAQPQPRHPALPKTQPQPQPQTEQEEDPMSAMMKAYVGMIVNGAKKNESPEDWANQILDSVPPHQVNELESLLKAPDWFAKLGTLNAGVGEYHVWFTELRSILLEFIHEDAQPEQGLTNDVVSTNLSGHEDDINRPEHEPGQPEASASGEPALVRSAEQGNASAHP